MPGTSILPNGLSGSNWADSRTGSALTPGHLADFSNSTWIGTSVGFPNSRLDVHFSTFALPTRAQVREVQVYFKGRASSSAGADDELTISLGREVGGVIEWAAAMVALVPVNGLFTVDSAGPLATSIAGNDWNQSDIDNLLVRFERRSAVTAGSTIDLAEAQVLVVYNQAPVVVVTAPTGSTVPTSRPTVTWTYSDPEGDPAEVTEVRVFSAAQYGATGFDPGSISVKPVWESGALYGSVTSAPLTADLLNNTTYRAYVRARDLGSVYRFGPWANSQFTVSLTPPPTPTMTATADSVLNRFTIVVTPGAGTPATQFFDVERSLDGGTTWATIRNGILAATGSAITMHDYEAPRATSVRYRTKARTVVGPNTVVSPWVTTAGVTLASDNKWWLKDPLSAGLNASIKAAPPFKYRPFREHVEVEDMLGRPDPVAVSDGRKLGAGTLAVWLHSKAEYDALLALLRTGRVLFLQSTLVGMEWYVRFEEPDLNLLHHSDAPNPGIAHHHRLELNWWEMAAPGVDLEPVRVAVPTGGDTFNDTF